MSRAEILIDDPRAEDARKLPVRNLEFSRSHMRAEHIHALDVEELVDSAVTFFDDLL